MTEIEWQAETNAGMLIAHLEGVASDRKLRLLACAFARQAQNYMKDPRSLRAVASAEAFADGLVDLKCLGAMEEAAQQAYDEWSESFHGGSLAQHAPDSLPRNEALVSGRAAACACFAATSYRFAPTPSPAWFAAQDTRGSLSGLYFDLVNHLQATDKARWHRHLADRDRHLREIVLEVFGNPFRVRATRPRWLSANATGIAHGIYANLQFQDMPILADALEDAGCDDGELLSHCRSDRQHVKGCWGLDFALGRHEDVESMAERERLQASLPAQIWPAINTVKQVLGSPVLVLNQLVTVTGTLAGPDDAFWLVDRLKPSSNRKQAIKVDIPEMETILRTANIASVVGGSYRYVLDVTATGTLRRLTRGEFAYALTAITSLEIQERYSQIKLI